MQTAFFIQLVLNGVATGLIISLGALGITLVFGIARFANVAAGDMATFGSYSALIFAGVTGSMMFGALGGMAMTAVLAMGMHLLVFQQLRGRSPIAFLVCSIGIAFMIRAAIGLAFGHSQHVFPMPLSRPYVIGDIRIGVVDLQVMIMAAAALAITFAILRFTSIGREMRAVADSVELARLSGIRARRVLLVLWIMVGALSTVSGLAVGLKAVITPEIGWDLLLPSFAAAILGGLGSPVGAVIAGILIGIAQEISTPWIGFSYKIALSFFVILAVLLARPGGLMGVTEKVR